MTFENYRIEQSASQLQQFASTPSSRKMNQVALSGGSFSVPAHQQQRITVLPAVHVPVLISFLKSASSLKKRIKLFSDSNCW